MKLSKEKTTELKKISDYFSKIEKAASKLGIDMDDFMNEYKNNNQAAYHSYKVKLLTKAEQRAATFKKAKSDPSEEEWVEKK
jgi:hypothetical protein